MTTRYELMMIASPEITSDESAKLESAIAQAIDENKGKLISFEQWGKYRLAYLIEGKEYGVYFLVRFEASDENANNVLSALHKLLSVAHVELVMRFRIFKLDPRASLSYHRPESLEETPSRDVESFLKDSKMTGLLHGRSERGKGSRDFNKNQEDLADIEDLEEPIETEA